MRRSRRAAARAGGAARCLGMACVVVAAVAAARAEPPPAFDGARALAHLERLMATGNRYYGAPERERAIAALVDGLGAHAGAVELQRFRVREPASGVEFALANAIARRNPGVEPRLLLGTHFDTRLWAEEDPDPARRDEPIPGANDGTSGVAVLLELLRVVDGDPRLREPSVLGDLTAAEAPPVDLPSVATAPEATEWLHANAYTPFLEEVRQERLGEVERVEEHLGW